MIRMRILGCVAAVGVASVLAAPPANAAGEPAWIRQFGTAGEDGVSGITVDGAGNIYLAGSTAGALAAANIGSTDAWVAKYNANGAMLWKRQVGTKQQDQATGISFSGGFIYIVGATYGSLGGSSAGSSDLWVVKYDPSGRLIWKRQRGSAKFDAATGVAAANGAVYVSGRTDRGVPGGAGDQSDGWVVKFDAAGRFLWDRQTGTRAGARGVALDNKGNVFLTGIQPYDFDYDNAWLVKFGPAGALQWRRKIGSIGYNEVEAIATSGTNVYLAGSSKRIGTAWVMRLDSSGQQLWEQAVGSEAQENGFAIATDNVGNIYSAGQTWGDFAGAAQGDGDAWAAKYNAAGDMIWARHLGSAGEDSASGVAVGPAGTAYITGTTTGSLGAANRGGTDVWLAKFAVSAGSTSSR